MANFPHDWEVWEPQVTKNNFFQVYYISENLSIYHYKNTLVSNTFSTELFPCIIGVINQDSLTDFAAYEKVPGKCKFELRGTKSRWLFGLGQYPHTKYK